MPGKQYSLGTYKYGFNGKEKDDEIDGGGNAYDFGARMLDPRISRWFSVDALQSKWAEYSPYCYAINTPIGAIDPDGKDVIVLIEFTAEGVPGHVRIAVDNYVEVKDEKGNVVYVPDGTVTVYELHASNNYNILQLLTPGKDRKGKVDHSNPAVNKAALLASYTGNPRKGLIEITLNAEGTKEMKR